jgi:hypothetical protein
MSRILGFIMHLGCFALIIQRRPGSKTGKVIKERLTELQKAIEEDTQLKPEDKADLLEQVEALAVATKTSDPDKKESLVRQAKKIFKATLDGLPDTAKLAEACSKLLPIILGLLGFAS